MVVKVIDMAKEGRLLPPRPGHCVACAVAHVESEPHNWQSLYWQYWWYGKFEKWPTLGDAFAHCSPEVKIRWLGKLLGLLDRYEDPAHRADIQRVIDQLKEIING
jgi:hypothetical protein